VLPEIGHFCLILALCLAGLQALFFAISFYPATKILNVVRPLALGQVFFVSLSFIILAYSFVTDDFSVRYIAQHSNSSLPIYYKLTALWGAHEGSLLLWVMILSVWILTVVIFSRTWPQNFSNKVLSILGLVNLGFLIFLLEYSNPFLRFMLDAPLDGADLNPLLQDFGMIIHPPMLYAGYVGSTVAFAFAVAALMEGKLDQTWASLVRPWVLSFWICLTLGIALGSWWAYYELGWGGWWFWDPVENASFMPWLTATALLHCLAMAAKNGQFLRLALFLAIATFALSLLGTFIVRSGVLTSVHAFVTDPERGLFILQFLTIIVGGALFLYGLRAPVLKLPATKKFSVCSTEAAILGNNLLLLVATGTVLLGTLYPLIYDVLFAQKISVGYPYFNAVFVPIMLVMLGILLPTILPQPKLLILVVLLSLTLAFIFLTFWFEITKFNAMLGLTIASAIIINSILACFKPNGKNKIPMSIAHIGLAVTIIGISITPAYELEKDIRLGIGDIVNIANYAVKFNGVSVIDGPNYLSYKGDFSVSKKSKPIAALYPEKRIYIAHEQAMTETAILPGLFQDIYIALGQEFADDQWSARIYYKPYVRWIWLGAIIMSLGALCGLLKRKKNYVK
jgi:cytochrome c-type biogenesis protein CcmF